VYDTYTNLVALTIIGNPAVITMVKRLVDNINAEKGDGTVTEDAIAKCLQLTVMPFLNAMDTERKQQEKNAYDKYCRMDEDDFYDLDEEEQLALQKEWGRTLYLVASDVNMMEECDLDPNFLADGRGDVYDIIVEFKNRRTGPDWRECNEYADIYIWATEEEIKRYVDSLKREKNLCDDWFGPHYKLAQY